MARIGHALRKGDESVENYALDWNLQGARRSKPEKKDRSGGSKKMLQNMERVKMLVGN